MKISNIYKIVAGAIMIFFGFCSIFDFGSDILVSANSTRGVCLTIFSIVAGIMCFISIKKKVFLIFSSIMCFFAGTICFFNIHSFNCFSIMCFVFLILNIIFYEKER